MECDFDDFGGEGVDEGVGVEVVVVYDIFDFFFDGGDVMGIGLMP